MPGANNWMGNIEQPVNPAYDPVSLSSRQGAGPLYRGKQRELRVRLEVSPWDLEELAC